MQGENRLWGLKCFRGVESNTVDQLWKAGSVRRMKKGTVFIHAKTPVDHVYVQLTGKSIIYNLTHDGRRKIIFIMGAGALLNENVFNSHYSSTFCEAIEESEVFVIAGREFLTWMERDFSLTRAVLEVQERKIWRLGHQLKNTMGSIYMERKLAAKLWKLSRDFGIPTELGVEIDLQLSITFLADLLGAPRETTSRLCGTLTDYGLMRMAKKRITIVDQEKMSAFYKEGRI